MSASVPDFGVTAVIPAYNMEQFVERAIRSAAAQTYEPLDILVIDDGSTDRTREISERLAGEIPNLKVETIENAGVAGARNRGIELAEKPYVAFLDADDLWHPQKIEKQVAAMKAHLGDPEWVACYTLSRFIDRADRVIGNDFSAEARGSFFFQHLHRNHVGNGSNLLVRRDVALEVGGFDPEFARRGEGGTEDYDFQLRLLVRYKLEVVREFLVGYRVYSGQMSDNPYRMANARSATLRKALASSGLPPAKAAHVRAHARLIHAQRMFFARRWLRVGSTLIGALVAQPRLVTRLLLDMAAKSRARRASVAGAARQEDSTTAPLFGELASQDGVTEHDDMLNRPRLRLRNMRLNTG